MSNSSMIFLTQLVSTSPTMLVCLGGMILAGMWRRRAPKAAMLAMAGLGTIFLATLASPLISMYLMNYRAGGNVAAVAQTVAALSIAMSVVRAAGMGLVIAGVFANRPRVDAGFPVQSHIDQPPLANLAPNNSSR